MAEELAERIEQPTPQRRDEARRQGQFARSPDLAAGGIFLTVLILLQLLGPRILALLQDLVREGLTSAANNDIAILPALWTGIRVIAPLLAGVIAIAIGVSVAQVGFQFRFRPGLLRGGGKRNGAQIVPVLTKL